MILLILSLWNRSYTQTVLCVFIWPVLHRFFMFCLSHISVSAHVAGCCQKAGSRVVKPCRSQMRDSVRTLLTFTHSTIVPMWSGFLLVTRQYDVESNSILQVQSLSFHLYSLYWNLRDFVGRRLPDHQHQTIRNSRRTITMFIFHNVLSATTLFCTLRAVSLEMNGWRSSVIDLMDLSMTWKYPTSTQRRVLSQHLLGKESAISWIATLQLLVHETPNMFFCLQGLMKMSPGRSSALDRSTLTAIHGNFKTNEERAASLGAAAWLRERGNGTGPGASGKLKTWCTEGRIQTVHFLSFAFIRIIGGFLALREILSLPSIVSDTVYLSSVLLHYALALYFFGGIITFVTKRRTRTSRGFVPARTIWLRIMTSFNDDWLQ